MATMIPFGNLSKFVSVSVTITPAQVAANTTAEQYFTCNGLKKGRDVIVNIMNPGFQAGLGIVGGRISADNNFSIAFSNNTASPITPYAAQTYDIVVAQKDSSQGNFS